MEPSLELPGRSRRGRTTGPATGCQGLGLPVRHAIVHGRRRPVGAAAHRRLVREFRAAARAGDLTELEDLLTMDLR